MCTRAICRRSCGLAPLFMLLCLASLCATESMHDPVLSSLPLWRWEAHDDNLPATAQGDSSANAEPLRCSSCQPLLAALPPSLLDATSRANQVPGDVLLFLDPDRRLLASFEASHLHHYLEGHTAHTEYVAASVEATIKAVSEHVQEINVCNDSSEWQLAVTTSTCLRVTSLFPGIDVTYSSSADGHLAYEFHVEPGASVDDIVMRFDGLCSPPRLNPITGDLLLSVTPTIALHHTAPILYQETASNCVVVEGGFALEPNCNTVVRFWAGDYDHSLPLIIDPLVYATYIGGGEDNVPPDDTGQLLGYYNDTVFISGTSDSASYPTTAGAYQPSYNLGGDVVVTALVPGSALLFFSTFIGGLYSDVGYAIALDESGNSYVSGETDSSNFPHLPADSNLAFVDDASNYDAFVLKLSANGGELAFSAILGGIDGGDVATGIAVDSTGSAYTVGTTTSTDFVLAHPFDSIGKTEGKCFVARLSVDGSTLIFSSYLGGNSSGIDDCQAIAIDSSSNAYVSGGSSSRDYPVVNAIIATNPSDSGGTAAVLTKINSTPSIAFSTYLGGTGNATSWGVAVDAEGSAIMVGQTDGTTFPSSTNYSGDIDVFVTKIAPNGSLIVFSRLLGGTGLDAGFGVAVDGNDNVYLCGVTQSTNFPVVNASQSTLSGIQDGFVAVLSPDGSSLLFATFIGGLNRDSANGVVPAMDGTGNVLVMGSAGGGLNVTANAYNHTFGGVLDFYVAVLGSGVISSATAPPSQSCGAQPLAGALVCVDGVWVVLSNTMPTTVNLFANETVLVEGSVLLQPNSSTTIQLPVSPTSAAPIVVNGSLALDGTLTLVLPVAANNAQVVKVISVTGDGEVNGTFSNVTVLAPNHSCQHVSGSFDDITLAVTIAVVSSGCSHNGLSRGAIAGIVVGAVVGVALLMLLALVLVQRFAPQHTLFAYNNKRDSDLFR